VSALQLPLWQWAVPPESQTPGTVNQRTHINMKSLAKSCKLHHEASGTITAMKHVQTHANTCNHMQSHAITYTCNVWPCGWSRVAHVCRWSRSVPQLWTTYRNASQTLKEVGKWAKMPLVSYRALAHWSRLDHMAACKGRDLHANSMIREPVETWHIFGYRQEVLKGKM